MNKIPIIAVLLSIFCLVVCLVKVNESDKQPIIIKNYILKEDEKEAEKPKENSIIFENPKAHVEDALEIGFIITAPEDIVIKAGDLDGCYLNEDKTYFFALLDDPVGYERVIKKGTKLTIEKIYDKNEDVVLYSAYRSMDGYPYPFNIYLFQLANTPESTSLLRVSTENEIFYLTLLSAKSIAVSKKDIYHLHIPKGHRNVTVEDVLKYSEILESD